MNTHMLKSVTDKHAPGEWNQRNRNKPKQEQYNTIISFSTRTIFLTLSFFNREFLFFNDSYIK